MSAGSRGEDDDRGSDEPVGEEDVIDEAEAGGGAAEPPGDETGDDAGSGAGPGAAGAAASGEAVDELGERVDSLRRELESFETDVEERTVHRSEIESELRGYVRARLRRGHARGWGPYLVLLYGTAMTIGAFYLLSGGWAILAMFVIWLSTLGLYVLMLIVGVILGIASLPGRAIRKVR